MTVSQGVARYDNLSITHAGEMYTLIATAPDLPSTISDTFDIFPGTGIKIAAVWDDSDNAYTIYTWIESE